MQIFKVRVKGVTPGACLQS